ncbi:MAG: hypothetical protein HRT92_07155 [Piscirickettsiaceae bacterium]|nr:hypothetical protein [Piscirickettsiaceae bacterium]
MNLSLKHFFSLPFWSKILHTFLHTCQRFPLVLVSLLLGISLGLDEIHKSGIFDANTSYKLFLTVFGGSLWFTASTLFSENRPLIYGDFIKIMFNGEMPHGHLSTMISLFGFVGIITHLAIYPIHVRNDEVEHLTGHLLIKVQH